MLLMPSPRFRKVSVELKGRITESCHNEPDPTRDQDPGGAVLIESVAVAAPPLRKRGFC